MKKINRSTSLLAQCYSKCLEDLKPDGRISADETKTVRKLLRSYLADEAAGPEDLVRGLTDFRELSDVAKKVVREAMLQ